MKTLLELGEYARAYKLPVDSVSIESKQASIDINEPGMPLHGSLKDPFLILKLGLVLQETKYFKEFKSNPQICIGLNNTEKSHTLKFNGSVKNTAVKYAGYFSNEGAVYILSTEVKNFITYKEQVEDFGDYKRGNAYLSESVPPNLIVGVITANLPRVAAAMIRAGLRIPIYTPSGVEYQLIEK